MDKLNGNVTSACRMEASFRVEWSPSGWRGTGKRGLILGDVGARVMNQHQIHIVQLQLGEAEVHRLHGRGEAFLVAGMEAARHPGVGPVGRARVEGNFGSDPQTARPP